MRQSNGNSGVRAVRSALPAAVLLCIAFAAPRAAVGHGREDAYILSLGNTTTISSVSVDEYESLRVRRGTDFLWIRRAGKAYLVEDPATLKQARELFAAERALEPEQEALRRREQDLDDREQELDRQEEELDRRMDASIEDEDEEEDENEVSTPVAPVSAAEREELERALSEIRSAQNEVHEAGRELERAERQLDAREDRLEREAEAKLWSLIDAAIKSGVAKPL